MSNKLSKPVLIVILLVFILLLLIGAGLVLLQQNPEITNLSIPFIKKTTSPSPSTQTNDNGTGTPLTTDWKTYQNTEYGFSFKYPAVYTADQLSKTNGGLRLAFTDANNRELLVEVTTKFIPGDSEVYQGKSPSSGFSFPNQTVWKEFYNAKAVEQNPTAPRRVQAEVNNRLYSVTVSEDTLIRLTLFNSFIFTK